MKVKKSRMEALKMLISSMELGSQEEVLQALEKEGFKLTQATLSRDLKQLKVAKAASMNGKYGYVLPNDTMYKRFTRPRTAAEMLQTSGFLSISFSGNLGVIKTRPGYASSIAYNIDNIVPFMLILFSSNLKENHKHSYIMTCKICSSKKFIGKIFFTSRLIH